MEGRPVSGHRVWHHAARGEGKSRCGAGLENKRRERVAGDAVGLDAEKDWRIALSIAGGLAARGDQRGVEAAEVMYADARLPDDARADAGNEFAVALIQSQCCRRAAAVLSDVLTKDPDSVPALPNLGVAKACQDDAEGARDAFLRVLQVQPGHELALRNLQALGAAAP